MKRSLINTLKILLFIAGFGAAVWYFLPWAEIGRFAMSTASSRLSSRGMRIGWSDVSGEDEGFTVHNLTINGMANFTFSSVTLRPQILSSILSLSAVCDISFRGGNIQLGQVMNIGDGRVLLTAGREEVLLENLRTTGEFGISGYMSVNPSAMRIVRANARLNVPDSFAQNLGMLRNFLPLVQDGDTWYIRRN
ncbi:MAG: hypothetical protein IJS28_05710 [Synergistaceae bacterium]|nr:hypothetical protein [Synergistaceae bacterium]